jgi:hypothetical protein
MTTAAKDDQETSDSILQFGSNLRTEFDSASMTVQALELQRERLAVVPSQDG